MAGLHQTFDRDQHQDLKTSDYFESVVFSTIKKVRIV